ncbi:hypothetical protein HZ326_18822 [Fusarium oxysporum f. sp. albedinis]|nr:hypothetical protein HZ326_18822 [Fusarium oxysporum f. sp. albedinis]
MIIRVAVTGADGRGRQKLDNSERLNGWTNNNSDFEQATHIKILVYGQLSYPESGQICKPPLGKHRGISQGKLN